jgi:hypothetical protein
LVASCAVVLSWQLMVSIDHEAATSAEPQICCCSPQTANRCFKCCTCS